MSLGKSRASTAWGKNWGQAVELGCVDPACLGWNLSRPWSSAVAERERSTKSQHLYSCFTTSSIRDQHPASNKPSSHLIASKQGFSSCS